PSPPPLCAHHPLPSARSIRGVEIRGTGRLINEQLANLQIRRVNVTTPVKDLLDFQKLTAGHFVVEMARIEVVELVEQTILDNEPFSEKFEVNVVLDGPDRPVYVNADAQRLKQVITNLLSNASKFSSSGGTVHVCVDASHQSCKVSVSNNGPGISQEFGARIFQPFSQQADPLTRSREGTGLGLAISKELVENMGGEIGYESTPSVRTTFWVRLPIFSKNGMS
ncbi:MAG: HAMP domain-containing sensor histidine kinase, partial [Sulfitobacter sp.]|uniref:sensor histidine kinase n=1 Tax=Sulfitobacter sp. TaxID=1903071 RepID=UPI0032975F5A